MYVCIRVCKVVQEKLQNETGKKVGNQAIMTKLPRWTAGGTVGDPVDAETVGSGEEHVFRVIVVQVNNLYPSTPCPLLHERCF